MITGFFGNLSSGKTLSCVKYCYDKYKSEGKITISNIKLNFPYKKLSLDELFDIAFSDDDKKKKDFFQDHILFIDELHNIVDARRSGSNLNQFFTQFATQLGKLDVDFIFTSQIMSSQIDLRIRELANVVVTCFKLDEKGNLVIFRPRISKEKVVIGMLVEVLLFGIDSEDNPKAFMSFDPSPYFGLYDTTELVILNRSKYLADKYNIK